MFLFSILHTANIVFVDESWLNRHYRRCMARAKRGVRVCDKKSGRRFARTNVIAGLCSTKHLAVRCYDHSTTAGFFEDWFEWELLSVVPEGSSTVKSSFMKLPQNMALLFCFCRLTARNLTLLKNPGLIWSVGSRAIACAFLRLILLLNGIFWSAVLNLNSYIYSC